jgi:hypothetical protein
MQKSSNKPKGILKKPDSNAEITRQALFWDEVNLMRNEEEKVPRMKIDEPKTPFHYIDGSTRISASSPERKRESSVSPEPKRSGKRYLLQFNSNELSEIALSRRQRDLKSDEESSSSEDENEESAKNELVDVQSEDSGKENL